jgi:uncharacterized phage-associated protein
MMPAHDVAKYFVSLVDEEAGDSISNLKLQKLLYYAQGFHLAMYDEALFSESIKAWLHGPVVPQVWHLYKDFGFQPIPIEPIVSNDYPLGVRNHLDEVYNVYGQFSASKLRDMTHDEAPWKNTPQNEVISPERMKEFFKRLVIFDDVSEPAAQ